MYTHVTGLLPEPIIFPARDAELDWGTLGIFNILCLANLVFIKKESYFLIVYSIKFAPRQYNRMHLPTHPADRHESGAYLSQFRSDLD